MAERTGRENGINNDESKIKLNSNVKEYVEEKLTQETIQNMQERIKFNGGGFKGLGLHQKQWYQKSCYKSMKKYYFAKRPPPQPDIAEGEIFQHDNFICHRSHVTKNCLADEDIAVIQDWTHKSPDLNIIEPIWRES